MPRLAFPEMNTPLRDVVRSDAVHLHDRETVGSALTRLRSENLGERIVYFYVLDSEGRLTGVLPTRRLLLSGPEVRVSDIMIHPAVACGDAEPFINALRAMREHHFAALPVTDSAGRLSGYVTLSDYACGIVDLHRREKSDELFQMVGVHIDDDSRKSTVAAALSRLPWLLCNIASGIGAAVISGHFSGLLESAVELAFFVPLMLTLAESIAMQTVTLSLSRIRSPQPVAEFAREVRTGTVLGLLSGAIAAAASLLWLGRADVAGVVAGGIVAAAAAGTIFGLLLPRLVHRWKLDPSVASGPAVLAVTDLFALVIYLGIAARIFRG